MSVDLAGWLAGWPWWAQHGGALVGVVALLGGARGWGKRLLHILALESAAGRGIGPGALQITIGLGLLAQVGFLLAWPGWATPPVMGALIAGGWLAGWGVQTAGVPAGGNRHRWGWPVIVLAVVLVPLGLCFVPEMEFDALRTHLWLAREMALGGRLPVDPANWNTYIPNGVAVLFGLVWGVAGEAGARLIAFSMGLLVALLPLAGPGGRPGRSIWWAYALMWLGLPVVAWLMSTAYTDLAQALFLTAALLAVWHWRRGGGSGWLGVAGLCLGFAWSCKYNALPWGVFLVGAVVWAARARGLRVGAAARAAIGVMLVAGLVMAPWLIRNVGETGNPLFPVPLPGFPLGPITPEIVEEVRRDQLGFGRGRGWADLALLPVRLVVSPEPFHGTAGLLPFLALPVLLGRWRRLSAWDWLALTGFGFGLVVWVDVGQSIRYLTPALPLAAWLAVRPATLAGGRWLRGVWVGLILIQAVWHLPPVYGRLHPGVVFQLRPGLDDWRVVTGQLSRDAYRTRRRPLFAGYRWANDHLTAPVRLLTFDAAAYWSRWPTLYSFSVEGGAVATGRDPVEVAAGLRQAGVTHILVDMAWVTPDVDLDRLPLPFDAVFQRTFLHEVYRAGSVGVWAVTPLAPPGGPPPGGQ